MDAQVAYRMEGAALTLGALMPSVLVKEERFRAALEGLARQYLVPLFASPHAFLRAKGAWLAGQYAQELKFEVAGESEKKRGRGALFDDLFDLVLRSMNDPCAPWAPPLLPSPPLPLLRSLLHALASTQSRAMQYVTKVAAATIATRTFSQVAPLLRLTRLCIRHAGTCRRK